MNNYKPSTTNAYPSTPERTTIIWNLPLESKNPTTKEYKNTSLPLDTQTITAASQPIPERTTIVWTLPQESNKSATQEYKNTSIPLDIKAITTAFQPRPGYSTTSLKMPQEPKKSLSREVNHTESLQDAKTFIEDIAKGVKKLPLIKRKRYFQFLTLLGVMLPFKPTQASASAINLVQLDKSKGLNILPPEIIALLYQLVGVSMGLALFAAAILLILSGGHQMIGNTDKSQKWNSQIVRGLGQVMLAPAIIIALATLTSLVLGNIDGLDMFY